MSMREAVLILVLIAFGWLAWSRIRAGDPQRAARRRARRIGGSWEKWQWPD